MNTVSNLARREVGKQMEKKIQTDNSLKYTKRYSIIASQ